MAVIATHEDDWLAKLHGQMAAKGWTKYKLAKKASLPQSTITSLLSGRVKNPSTDTLTKIANALGISISILVGETDHLHQHGIDGSRQVAGLGKRIKELRDMSNMTQPQMAAELDKSRSAVAMWETGKADPSVAMIIDIAELFGVTTDYLLKGSEGGANSNRRSVSDIQDMKNRISSLEQDMRKLKSLLKGWCESERTEPDI